MRSKLSVRNIFIAFAILGLSILLLFFKLPSSVQASGQLVPLREWLVTRGTGGNCVFTLYNYEYDQVDVYDIIEVERGDISSFSLHPEITRRRWIGKGDTIGNFYSNQLERELARLKGELAAERSSLDFYASGEKASVIEQARQQLAYARAQAVEQQKILIRQKDLFDKGLISEQEYELSSTSAALAEANVAVMEANLVSVSTGAKDAQIQYSQNRVKALRDEIGELERRKEKFTITCPVSGRIVHSASPDTLLMVMDSTSHLVRMLIPIKDYPSLRVGSAVRLHMPLLNVTLRGYLHRVDQIVRVVNGEQVVLANARLEEQLDLPLAGVRLDCTIQSGSLTIAQHVKRLFSGVSIR